MLKYINKPYFSVFRGSSSTGSPRRQRLTKAPGTYDRTSNRPASSLHPSGPTLCAASAVPRRRERAYATTGLLHICARAYLINSIYRPACPPKGCSSRKKAVRPQRTVRQSCTANHFFATINIRSEIKFVFLPPITILCFILMDDYHANNNQSLCR